MTKLLFKNRLICLLECGCWKCIYFL